MLGSVASYGFSVATVGVLVYAILGSPTVGMAALNYFDRIKFSKDFAKEFMQKYPFLVLAVSPSVSSFSSFATHFQTFVSLFAVICCFS